MNESTIPCVRDYMTEHLITVSANISVEEAADVLIEKKISGAPVLDEEGLVAGILSEKDCMMELVDSIENNRPVKKTAEIMIEAIWTVEKSTTLLSLAKIFNDTKFGRLPVVENKQIVGQISIEDCLRGLRKWKSSK